MAEDMPMPPYPKADDALLAFIVRQAVASIESGEIDIPNAVLHAVVHGWLEGHLEGEQCVEDCYTNERWQGPRMLPGDPEMN